MKSKHLRKIIGDKNRRRIPEDLADLVKLSSDDLVSRGISRRDAEVIVAAMALASEISEPQGKYRTIRITSTAIAMQYCQREFRALACQGVQEEFHVVTLDTKNQPIQTHLITRGTLRNSLVHPREVFRPAIADAANCILVVHNHPSGDPEPSDQDLQVTKRLEEAAEIIGIPVIDHIIVAGDRALSIQEHRTGVTR
jgi:DNA repair protein RadC